MHPFVKVIFLLIFLLLINVINQPFVWFLCVITCVLVMLFGNGKFLLTVQRMRWLWVSILIIYAFTTPGEYIPAFPTQFSPTIEGVQLGMLQILKLLIAIACLNLLFSTCSKEDLLAAFIRLVRPFQWLGLNVERFAARLFLTLDYVERLATESKLSFAQLNFQLLDAMHATTLHLSQQKVKIAQPPLLLMDKIALCVIIFIGLAVLLKTYT